MANCISVITLCEDSFTVCGDVGLDISEMMSTPISGITSLKEFKDTMVSELIDAKHFKTQSSYPTLRLVYERYMNSTAYCDTQSSQFDYCDMLQFSELVGTYWVDLIEQVVPATTIWGSTYVYGNTLWDQQKFTYKKYSLYSCNLPNLGGNVVSPTTGWTDDVQVELETLQNDSYYDEISGSTTGNTFSDIEYNRKPLIKQSSSDLSCMGVGIIQTNCGSEFVGKIVDYRKPSGGTGGTGGTGGDIIVTECAISVDVELTNTHTSGYSAYANISGDITGPISFLWNNGETTQSITNLDYNQSYSVTVYDNGIEGCSTSQYFTTPEPSIGDCAHGGFVFYLDGNGGGLVCSNTDITGVTSCEEFRWHGQITGFLWTGTTSENIGTGLVNTNTIISDSQPEDDNQYAAKLALEYVNPNVCGVYNDWYLPSLDELNTMRTNLLTVGDLQVDFNFDSGVISPGCFAPGDYWSSTSDDSGNTVNSAWAVTMESFTSGPQIRPMTQKRKVRTIREF